jgi:hypothetical protein
MPLGRFCIPEFGVNTVQDYKPQNITLILTQQTELDSDEHKDLATEYVAGRKALFKQYVLVLLMKALGLHHRCCCSVWLVELTRSLSSRSRTRRAGCATGRRHAGDAAVSLLRCCRRRRRWVLPFRAGGNNASSVYTEDVVHSSCWLLQESWICRLNREDPYSVTDRLTGVE